MVFLYLGLKFYFAGKFLLKNYQKYFTYICNYLHMSEYTYILEFRKV
jgi:hypothetical protein